MKYIVLALAICFAVTSASAQEVYSSSGKSLSQVKREREKKKQPKGFDPSRIIFGGGFALGIGDVTDLGLSPIVGYKFTDKFAAGIGVGYEYLKVKDYWELPDYSSTTGANIYRPWKSNNFYPSVWARYIFWRNLFAHVEYQHTFFSYKTYTLDYTQPVPPVVSYNSTYNEPAVWAGIGLKQPLSDRISFVVMGLYDVLPDNLHLYNGRLDIRFGINAGF